MGGISVPRGGAAGDSELAFTDMSKVARIVPAHRWVSFWDMLIRTARIKRVFAQGRKL
jgi:hypothetical protein